MEPVLVELSVELSEEELQEEISKKEQNRKARKRLCGFAHLPILDAPFLFIKSNRILNLSDRTVKYSSKIYAMTLPINNDN